MPPQPSQPQTPPQAPPQAPTQDPSMMGGMAGGGAGGVAPEGPTMDPSQHPVSDEEKQALLELIEKIHQNLGNLTAQDFAAKNHIDIIRRDLLRQVLQKLQMAGVDLSDRESVAEFMKNLASQNPQLAQQFEKAMEELLGGPQQEGGDAGAPVQDPAQDPNMNQQNPNETPPQTV